MDLHSSNPCYSWFTCTLRPWTSLISPSLSFLIKGKKGITSVSISYITVWVWRQNEIMPKKVYLNYKRLSKKQLLHFNHLSQMFVYCVLPKMNSIFQKNKLKLSLQSRQKEGTWCPNIKARNLQTGKNFNRGKIIFTVKGTDLPLALLSPFRQESWGSQSSVLRQKSQNS